MAKQLKSEIKYAFQLCDEQKEAKRLILENEIVIITGNPGSGKSAVVACTALDLLFKKEIDKIILYRPTVEVGKTLGLLPGMKNEKIEPYLEAFVASMMKCYPHPEKILKELEGGKITTDAIQFVRGKNFYERELILCDESQNCTPSEIEALVTRVEGGARLVLLGDVRQCDIQGRSGLELAFELSKNIEEIKHIHLKENHRSGVVKKIIDYIYGIEV